MLRSRDILLVLDNFEHVLDAAAAVGELARGAAGVLVTSREALRVAGEHVYALEPLRVAMEEGEVAGRQGDATRSPAVELFHQRALESGTSATTLDQDQDAVVDICSHLDGLPLAIELAAARTSVLSPRGIADRLGKRLSLLTSGTRDADDRHRTLRACIEWSVDPLPGPDRRLLSILSMFPAGATLQALEIVDAADPVAILDRLEHLVAKSLARREPDPTADRYRLLHVIREFANDLLELQPDVDDLRARYVAYYHQAYAREVSVVMWPPRTAAELHAYRQDLPNARAALDLCLTTGDINRYADLVVVLARIWNGMPGSYDEALIHLARVVTLGAPVPPVRTIDALLMQITLDRHDEDIAGRLQGVRALLAAHPDPLQEMRLAFHDFWVAVDHVDTNRAWESYETARSAAVASGDPEAVAYVEVLLDGLQPRPADALHRLEEALRTVRRHGNDYLQMLLTTALSGLLLREGNDAEEWSSAREYARSGEELARAFYRDDMRVVGLLVQAQVAVLMRDDLDDAVGLARDALWIGRRESEAEAQLASLVVLAAVYAAQGNQAAAVDSYLAAKRIDDERGYGLQASLAWAERAVAPLLDLIGNLPAGEFDAAMARAKPLPVEALLDASLLVR